MFRLRICYIYDFNVSFFFFPSFQVMPLSGYFVSKLLNLPSHYAVGLILVGCCPGGMFDSIHIICTCVFIFFSVYPHLPL